MGRRPRIGLDARMVDTQASGLGRYARELVRRLPALAPGADFVVIKRQVMAGERLADAPNATEVVIPGLLDHPANLLSAVPLTTLGLDLYHSLHHFLPPGLRVAHALMTLHDLIWVEHADLTFAGRWAWPKARANQLYGTATMWHALRRADHVVAISAWSRDRAVARFGTPPERFTVIHHGVDHARLAPAGPHREPVEPVLLSLGNSKPYKNLPTLLDAFAAVARRHPDTSLALVGRGDSVPELRRQAERLGITRQVHWTGMIDDAEVLRLMREARALVFPSLIEGFGFPLVEAMAAGCPVVTSDIPVIEEVVGEAALRVPPTDTAALTAALERILGDPALRASLREKGLARARHFQWDEAARKTLRAYRTAAPELHL